MRNYSSRTVPPPRVTVVQPSSTTTIQPAASGSNPWTLSSYTSLTIPTGATTVVEVLAIAAVLGKSTLAAGSAQTYVGPLVVAEAGTLTAQPSSVANLAVDSAYITLPQGYQAANLELSWTAPASGSVRAYDVGYTDTANGQQSQVWAGRTTNTMFWLGNFVWPALAGQTWPTELQWVVQVIGANGVEQAASVSFTWSPPSS